MGIWNILRNRSVVDARRAAARSSLSGDVDCCNSTSPTHAQPDPAQITNSTSTFNQTTATAPTPRRQTLPPSHINSIRRKTRASLAPTATPPPPPTAPFTLGIITPRSLERYGLLLQGGFLECMQRDSAILKRVELLVPGADESHASFSSRVRAHGLDILLIQYHGSSQEDVVAFLDYGITTQRILLLHRPEEILERHNQHVFKQSQFNIIHLLREVDVTVVLGEAARGIVQKVLPADLSENVCVVPHGFSGIDDTLAKPRKLTPAVVVGAITTYGDMRWLADLIQLHDTFLKRQQESKGNTAQVVVYGGGRFSTYVDPKDKTIIVDQLADFSSRFPDRLAIVSPSVFADAGLTDVASLKSLLWRLSDQGRKVVICSDDGSGTLFTDPLQTQVFDFTTQLYREHLKEFRPKMEFSGALHAHPGMAIPIVFDSTAMGDVEIEGMQMIIVPYPDGADDSSCCGTDESGQPAAFPDCCPWYGGRNECPDFRPAVDAIYRYVAQPGHYQSHRQATYLAAKELSMRHVAAQYAQVIRSITGTL